MHLNYVQISQPVATVLAYKEGSAVVSLANKRIALLEPAVLSKAGINPADGPHDQALATRIAAMREALSGKHVALIRRGSRLYVTGVFESPLEVLQVSDENVAEICEHVSGGARLTPAMKIVMKFLDRAKHPNLVSIRERIRACMQEENPTEGWAAVRAHL